MKILITNTAFQTPKTFAMSRNHFNVENVSLSRREKEVLQLIAHEYSTKEIAEILHVCYETAHSHRKNLLRKLRAKNAAGLIRIAFEKGLLTL